MITLLQVLTTAYAILLLLRRFLAESYAQSLPPIPREPLPPDTLTIAQAILSGDPLLESRLEANVKTLPTQRFIWLIDDTDTEAQRIAAKLQRPHLHVELCPPCPDTINPKLWKLQIAARLTQTPFFAVIDDDTTLPESSASALVHAAQSHTISTGLPCYQDSGDFPSGMLAQFVNNNSAFTYLGTSRLLPPFTLNGMGYVMRREELARIDNFAPILHELTDDLALATLVLKLGGTIHQSNAPLHVQTGVRNFRHYMQMMHRWYVFTLLLLQRQRIHVQAIIFILHGLPPQLFIGIVVISILCLNLPLLAALIILRMLVLHQIQKRSFGRSLHHPLISLLSELIQPVHLIHALCSRTIRWRTRLYKVRDTHDFHEV